MVPLVFCAGVVRLPLLILSFLLPYLIASAEPAPPANPRYTGSSIVRTWLAEDYGAHPESHALLQHPHTGFLYVGNNAGVLEFDGVRWRLIRLPNGAAVRTLAVDGHGRVWAAGIGEICVLMPDARGELHAESAQARLPPLTLPLMMVGDSLVADGGVYFRDPHRLLFFADDGGPARVWLLGDGTNQTPVIGLRLWQMDGAPHVLIGGDVTVVGPPTVRRLRDGEMQPTPGPSAFVLAARPRPGGGAELLDEDGVTHWDGTRLTSVSRPLDGDTAQVALWLADGRIVFGTRRSGIVLCDRDGRFLQRIDRSRGLPANNVFALCEDREGGVWAAFRSGLARVQLDSPYALHGPPQGIDGTIQSLARRGNELFVGGSEGVARRDARGRFQPLAEVPGGIREVAVHGDRLYILGQQLLALGPAANERARELEDRNYYGLLPSTRFPGWFFHGANQGVRWARNDSHGNWVHEPTWSLNAFAGPTTALIEEPAGILWAFGTSGLWRIDFRAGLQPDAPARRFGPAEGIAAADGVQMAKLGSSLVALTQGSLFRYDAAATRFFPDTRIAGLDGAAAGNIEFLHVDGDGTLWLQARAPRREIYRLVAAGAERWRAERLPEPALSHLMPTALFHEPATRTLWIAGFGALVSRDLDWQNSHATAPPAAIVRRIETAAGVVLRSGSLGTAASGVADSAPLSLAPDQNALRISFAAPCYETDHAGVPHTVYRTRLDGLDGAWSEWSAQAQRDFTNLPWRTFTFRVQARDDEGRIGPEATLRFTIAPPAWATGWAWAGYAALAALGVGGIVRLRTGALRRRQARLEGIVADRTRALAQSNTALAAQNAELERLHQIDRDEKAALRLAEERTRLELLRYQLNPHFLLNAFTTLRSTVFSSPPAAATMIERLSDFCRLALTRTDENGGTVDDEIRLIESYLETEKARWRDELSVGFEIDPAARARRLPPFLLQPLVENAVKYGSATSPGVLQIRVRIAAESESLAIEIANTGAWVEENDPHRAGSTGIGHQNLHQRLRRYYRDAHEFTTEARDGWVVVRLWLGRPAPEIPPAN